MGTVLTTSLLINKQFLVEWKIMLPKINNISILKFYFLYLFLKNCCVESIYLNKNDFPFSIKYILIEIQYVYILAQSWANIPIIVQYFNYWPVWKYCCNIGMLTFCQYYANIDKTYLPNIKPVNSTILATTALNLRSADLFPM